MALSSPYCPQPSRLVHFTRVQGGVQNLHHRCQKTINQIPNGRQQSDNYECGRVAQKGIFSFKWYLAWFFANAQNVWDIGHIVFAMAVCLFCFYTTDISYRFCAWSNSLFQYFYISKQIPCRTLYCLINPTNRWFHCSQSLIGLYLFLCPTIKKPTAPLNLTSNYVLSALQNDTYCTASVFSDVMPLSAGWHLLSVPFKVITNYCWKTNPFCDPTLQLRFGRIL